VTYSFQTLHSIFQFGPCYSYEKNLRLTQAHRAFQRVVKFIIKMNRLRSIVAIDRKEIKRQLGIVVSPAKDDDDDDIKVPSFHDDSKSESKSLVLEASPRNLLGGSASEMNAQKYEEQVIERIPNSNSRRNTRLSRNILKKKRRSSLNDFSQGFVRMSTSTIDHEGTADIWKPRKGMIVTVKGWGVNHLGTLEASYRGAIKYMQQQEYWWITDVKGVRKVAPLADIKPAPHGSKFIMHNDVKALASAKAVFDVRSRRATVAQVQERTDIIHHFDTILGLSLDLEPARDQLLQIIVKEKERFALLLYVDIQSFRKAFEKFQSPEGKEPAGMRLRAIEIYGAFIRKGAPLQCTCLSEETRKKIDESINLDGKSWRPNMFNRAQEECLAHIRKTTWSELTKLWIILIKLWRRSSQKEELKSMDTRVKVLRNYMPKSFLRLFGSSALCLHAEGRYTIEKQMGAIYGNLGQSERVLARSTATSSGTNTFNRRDYKEAKGNGHIFFEKKSGQINEKEIFMEGFLSKKYLTRSGYSQRLVRIELKKDKDDDETVVDSLPKVVLCYYNTNDDEDVRLKPSFQVEINEYFKIRLDKADPFSFRVMGAKYVKERFTPNALYELGSKGLTLKARTRTERDRWIAALKRFMPKNEQIDLSLRAVIEQLEYALNHMESFLHGSSFSMEGSTFGSHRFLFRRYPEARAAVRRMTRNGLIGALREFFAEQWDPAFGAAWKFFNQLMNAVHDRTRLRYQKKSFRKLDIPGEKDRRFSLVDSFKCIFKGNKYRGSLSPRAGEELQKKEVFCKG